MTRRILVVEDDRDIADLLRINLNDLGREVKVVHNGPRLPTSPATAPPPPPCLPRPCCAKA